MLVELRQERDGIDEAIAVLARIAAGRGRRRTRPPSWMKLVVKRRGRPPGSKNAVSTPPLLDNPTPPTAPKKRRRTFTAASGRSKRIECGSSGQLGERRFLSDVVDIRPVMMMI